MLKRIFNPKRFTGVNSFNRLPVRIPRQASGMVFFGLKILLGFLFFVFGFYSINAQENTLLDSLSKLLKTAPEDTSKVIILNDLGWELKFKNPQLARVYLDSALSLSIKLGYKKGEGNANNYRGVVEDIHGNSELAIEYFQKALDIRRELGDRKGVASLYNNIGNVNENLGDYVAALDNYQKSLRIREETADSTRMARLYYNISILHDEMGNFPEALDFIFRYLEMTEHTGDLTGVANAHNVIGNIKTELERYEEAAESYEKALDGHTAQGNDWELGTVLNNLGNLKDAIGEDLLDQSDNEEALVFFNEAIEYHKKALEVRIKLEDAAGQSATHNNMGYVYKNMGSYFDEKGDGANAQKYWGEGLKYLDKALTHRKNSGDKAGEMEVYNGIADIRRRQKQFGTALTYTERYRQIAEEIGDIKYIQNALKDLARIHFAMGNYKGAYEFRKEYDELRYSRFNDQLNKSNERREVLYSDRKKEYEIERQKNELLLREAELKRGVILRNSLIGGAFGLVLLIALLFNRNRIKTKSNRELEEKNRIIETERHRSEDLLLNILPGATAMELKTYGKAKAKHYDSVTVLFTDFLSFTQIAEKMTPEELVAELDECFKAFDEIVSKFGIEKIKTIGDSYMCAGGLPTPNETHAGDVVKAALEMRNFMKRFGERQNQKGRPEFRTRFGIHTGPVVAGVVGSKKFAYDIWGDTVNLAARMEEKSEAGKINISKNTYELVRHEFQCENRGKLIVKNKGEVEMYFVEGL